jgi:peptidase E
MIDTTDPLLSELADHFVELHNVGGIELEQWETAHQFVKHFYNTEEMVQIIIREKKQCI